MSRVSPQADSLRVCKWCGGAIPKGRDKKALYCSKKCNWTVENEKRKAKILASLATLKCHRCGSPIPDAKTHKRKWCSELCKDRAERDRDRERIRLYHRRWSHLRMYGHDEYVAKPSRNKYDKYGAARELGFRSGLEVQVARQLDEAGVKYGYETVRIPYTQPAEKKAYIPDFVLPNGIVVEAKGRLETSDRKKMKFIKEQHPDLDIRFLFSSSRKTISKISKTTYGAWAEKLGFPYADKFIPEDWIREPPNEASLKVLKALERQ